LRPLSVLVLLLLLSVTVATVCLARWLVHDQEDELLRQRATEVAALYTVAISSVQTSLNSAAAVAAATNADPYRFTTFAQGLIRSKANPEGYASVSLVAASTSGRRLAATVGDDLAPGRLSDGDVVRAIDNARKSGFAGTRVLVTGRGAGAALRIGLAVGPPVAPSGYIVYAEMPITPYAAVDAPRTDDTAFGELRGAIYASATSDPSQVLVSSARNLPLHGQVARQTISVGPDKWLIEIQPRGSLIAGVAARLPWRLLIAGLVFTALGTTVVEVVGRRRRVAEALATENIRLLDQVREANARLATEMRVREHQLSGLVAFSVAMSHPGRVLDTLAVGLESLVGDVGLDPAAIYLVREDEEQAEPLLTACRGDWCPPLSIAAPAGPVGAAVCGEPARSVDTVRITAGEELIGVLVVDSASEKHDFLCALGAQLGTAISSARRLERESETVRRLTELGRLRSNLIAGVSHELRTPLTAMIGLTQTVRMRELPKELQDDFLDQILRQTERLKRLVADLLDETRLSTGVLSVTCEPVSVCTLLDHVASSFLHIDQHLEISCPEDLPLVLADRQRLEQVLANLVDNATKYAPVRSTIRVVGCVDDAGVAISVTDEGPGVDAAFLPRMFEAFAQGNSSDTSRHSGLGLGLSIARGLVEAMHARIEVESRPGEGATFTVRLQCYERGGELPMPHQRGIEAAGVMATARQTAVGL
jgi:signal transduction histidine kinase